MDRNIFFGILLAAILWLSYLLLTRGDAFLICLLIIFLIVFGGIGFMTYDMIMTKKYKLGNNIVVSMSEIYSGKWTENNGTFKIDCLNYEVPIISYQFVGKEYYETYVSSARSGPIKYDYYKVHEAKISGDIIEVLYFEFKNAEDNQKAKDELIKNFKISESKYTASIANIDNRCAIWNIKGVGIKSLKLK